jgi:hypothetical protein
MSRRRKTGLSLGGACGQLESGHRDTIREQCPGNGSVEGAGGVQLVIPKWVSSRKT